MQTQVLLLFILRKNKFLGGADVNANYNLFINEANEVDFSGKEIPLGC